MNLTNRYAVRIGSVFALLFGLAAYTCAQAAIADRSTFTFEGKRITFSHLSAQAGGRAVAIDDSGLRALFEAVGATVTFQPGERYVLVTTAEPVVISFAIGDPRYDVGPVTQTAAFSPFLLDGHAYVPFDALLRALNLAQKNDVLQPQLTSVDIDSNANGTKLIARGGMPLDAKILSDAGDKIVVAFDGVGTTLQPSRAIAGGPVRRIDIRTEGTVTHPRTIATFYVVPGTTHTAAGSDDQRDFTIGFNGAPSAQAVAAAPPAESPPPTPAPSPAASNEPVEPAAVPGPAQVTALQTHAQNGSFIVRVALNGNATYDWHRLHPPDNRWWIDIHNARLAMPPSDQAGNAPVTGVRLHQQSSDTARVALSLSDYDLVDVTPDATGITITVKNALADDTAARTGSGSIGDSAVAYASPAPGDAWKFAPRSPAPSTYVAANPRLIVIDPGHGGSDWGSYRGDVVEKTLALDMSKRLRDILVARGWQVIMTRETDKDVFAANDSGHDELQARDDIANNNGARLFVSVHVNAFINSGPHGATVYYYKPVDFALAQAVNRRIGVQSGIKADGTVKDKLYVVHHANMPAALVETAFISNPDDRELLQSPQWRQKMAQAIADGIADYAGAPPSASSAGGQ